jgi:hypothetical protein
MLQHARASSCVEGQSKGSALVHSVLASTAAAALQKPEYYNDGKP